MSYSYPIWHDVQACHYKSSKSYGGVSDSGETIYVGTSKKNSYKHCDIMTTKRKKEHSKYGFCMVFRTSVDNIILKETWVSIKERRIVKVVDKLKRIKSL